MDYLPPARDEDMETNIDEDELLEEMINEEVFDARGWETSDTDVGEYFYRKNILQLLENWSMDDEDEFLSEDSQKESQDSQEI